MSLTSVPTGVAPPPERVPGDERAALLEGLRERLQFETLLGDLSASFVNLPAHEVDAHVNRALQQLVDFLEVERSGLGELSADGKQLLVTHTYVVPGFPPLAIRVMDDQLPWYTRQIRQGRLLRLERLPDDLPPEAAPEREYCTRIGLKAHLAIPLTAGGAVLGTLGFGAFRACREWPDALVHRLQLIGEVFANALARKNAEEQMHCLRDQLSRVARVTTLGELAAAIAHEINQPLCAVVTNAQAGLRLMAGAAPDLEEARDTFRDIAADSKRASEVIGRIRDLLQHRPPARATLDLNDALREVLALVSGQLKRKGIALALDLAGDVPPVHGDRVQLQQVVLNLTVNAIEALGRSAAPGEPARPRLLSVRSAGGGGAATVSVCDTGPGIAPEHFGKVFDAFFTTKPGGIGVGLAICRSIVEGHGGTIRAEAGPAGGAAFHFTLPAARSSP
jgi:signal transduction histidine kinase